MLPAVCKQRCWAVFRCGVLTKFETFDAAVDYNFAVLGSELLVYVAGGFHKLLKAHKREWWQLMKMRRQVWKEVSE